MFCRPIMTSIMKPYCNTYYKYQIRYLLCQCMLFCMQEYYAMRSHSHTHDRARGAQFFVTQSSFPNEATNHTLRYVLKFQSSYSWVRKRNGGGGGRAPGSLRTQHTLFWGSRIQLLYVYNKNNFLQIYKDFHNPNSSIKWYV